MTDVLVIGAGPARVVAALRAADLGVQAAQVTSGAFGGMAGNDGPVSVQIIHTHTGRLMRVDDLARIPTSYPTFAGILVSVAVKAAHELGLTIGWQAHQAEQFGESGSQAARRNLQNLRKRENHQ
jgi:hypothetical protein